jgi:sugar phosphate isomerase/epimerase
VFRLGYNTNGLAHHRVVDALRLVAELGYEALAITPDVGQLDPFHASERDVAAVRAAAEDLGLELALETGARYLLDPRRKHFPTLLEDAAADRARRVDLLRRTVDLAAALGAGVVSFWAGAVPANAIGAVGDARAGAGAHDALWDRLAAGCEAALDHARDTGVRLAFEPEPGMFVERPAGYRELRRRLGARGGELGLCLDVGHCLCTGDLPIPDVIRAHALDLAMVHLDDVQGGVHEHRMFGEGELDLRGTLAALVETGYGGIAAVELSRDSHRGPAAAREAFGHLRRALA